VDRRLLVSESAGQVDVGDRATLGADSFRDVRQRASEPVHGKDPPHERFWDGLTGSSISRRAAAVDDVTMPNLRIRTNARTNRDDPAQDAFGTGYDTEAGPCARVSAHRNPETIRTVIDDIDASARDCATTSTMRSAGRAAAIGTAAVTLQESLTWPLHRRTGSRRWRDMQGPEPARILTLSTTGRRASRNKIGSHPRSGGPIRAARHTRAETRAGRQPSAGDAPRDSPISRRDASFDSPAVVPTSPEFCFRHELGCASGAGAREPLRAGLDLAVT
jgi:hypothetical protein